MKSNVKYRTVSKQFLFDPSRINKIYRILVKINRKLYVVKWFPIKRFMLQYFLLNRNQL